MDEKELSTTEDEVLKQASSKELNDIDVLKRLTAGRQNDKSTSKMWTCMFCAEEFLFEFSMKEHLKKRHLDEMRKLDVWPVEQFFCNYCEAMFYYSSLIPKHIYFAHGQQALEAHFKTGDNLQKYQIDKENSDPSVKFFDCSPGLSSLFNDMETCDSIKKFKLDSACSTPFSTPKSILKKTPYSGKIVILSPDSAALRRTINNLKRTASARRELRFDLPPQANSLEEVKTQPSPLLNFDTTPKKKHFWNLFSSEKSPINTKIKKKIRAKACKITNRTANQIITSTPTALNDDSEDDGCGELDHSIGSNWKSAVKTSNFRPLFLKAERFQCNFCQAKFDCNAELLFHQKNHHRRISFLPPFKCGQCSSTFYRNSYLVRHCNYLHTPSKK